MVVHSENANRTVGVHSCLTNGSAFVTPPLAFVSSSTPPLCSPKYTTNPPKELSKNSPNLGVAHAVNAAMLSFVQRLFSMFPQGGPGFALLLLRISVAATFLMNLANPPGVAFRYLLFACAGLIALSLSIGFLTPFLAVIACASGVANLLIGSHAGNLISVFLILDATALALLGPGAYSLDARLFGRRVMVVPPRKDTNQY